MQYFGLDVSSWQGVINWHKLHNTGKIDFIILRAGGSDGSLFRDPKFEYNYKIQQNRHNWYLKEIQIYLF